MNGGDGREVRGSSSLRFSGGSLDRIDWYAASRRARSSASTTNVTLTDKNRSTPSGFRLKVPVSVVSRAGGVP